MNNFSNLKNIYIHIVKNSRYSCCKFIFRLSVEIVLSFIPFLYELVYHANSTFEVAMTVLADFRCTH